MKKFLVPPQEQRLDVNDFSLSISGGTATLSSTIPTSISYSENLRATNYSENIANSYLGK